MSYAEPNEQSASTPQAGIFVALRALATRASSLPAGGSGAPSASSARLLLSSFSAAGVSLIVAGALLLGTAAPAAAAEACPANEAIREAQGAFAKALPDCRAYELVSPGAHPKVNGRSAGAGQGARASTNGEGFAYVARYPAEGAQTSSFAYLSTRAAGGWSTQPVDPQDSPSANDDFQCYQEFDFSPDLSQGVLADGGRGFEAPDCPRAEEELAPGAPSGYRNLFLRDNATGSYQLVNVTPQTALPNNALFAAASTDFSHIVFTDAAQLTPEAPAGASLYEWADGAVHLLTYLPHGEPAQGGIVGSGSLESFAQIQHAVSTDGERVFFTAEGNLYLRENAAQEPSHVNGEGKCTEPAQACTIQIDASQVAGPGGGGEFYDAAADGSRVFFADQNKLTGESTAEPGAPDIYEYDVQTGQLTDLTVDNAEPARVQGYVGAAEDGSYLYFIAATKLASNLNSQGDGAVARATGTGTLSFATGTGTLSAGSEQLSTVSASEGEFEVGQQISGQGITPATTITAVSSGTLELSSPATETGEFSLSAGSSQVTSLSASSGSFLVGQAISGTGIPPGTTITAVGPGTLELSARPTASGPQALTASAPNLYLEHGGATTFVATLSVKDYQEATVSPNGQFLLFTSIKPLTGFDNTPAGSTKCETRASFEGPCDEIFRYDAPADQLSCVSCDPEGARPAGPSYLPFPEVFGAEEPAAAYLLRSALDDGRVLFDTPNALVPRDTDATSDVYEYENGQPHLISSGTDPAGSYFYDAAPSGKDVFFVTGQDLLRSDTNRNVSVYDAREGGGFPEPPPPPLCEGEACRLGASVPPASSSTPTSSFEGSGNPKVTGCRKGSVKKHGHCVSRKHHAKKHHRKHKRAASHSRGGGK